MKKVLLLMACLFSVVGMWADTYEWSHGASSPTLTVTAAKGSSDANTYSNYSISYGGSTYTSCVKMESATTLTFTTTKTSTITVGVALKNSNSYANASKTALSLTTNGGTAVTANTGITSSTTGAYTEDGLSVVFSNVAAGTQVIKRAGSEEGVFYIKVEEQNENQAVKPTITATWGKTFGSNTTVTLTTGTEDATIYYTLDGTTPTAQSTAYTSAFEVSNACTVKAIAVKSGLTNSEVASQDVTINDQYNIAFDFSGVTLTQGSALAATTASKDASYVLPAGRMYYVDGKTQTGWSDGTKTYALGESVTVDKDYTFTPIFADNTVALADSKSEVTVNWTFATKDGAPSAGVEGKVGYYAAQTKVNDSALDVVMKINAEKGAAGTGYEDVNGKFNTTSADNRAQVNKGTVFTIPAIAGMTVTYTATNGTPKTTSATFAGEAGEVSGSSIIYTYNGTASTIDIIDCGDNLYPSGLSVVYPKAAPVTYAITATTADATMGSASVSAASVEAGSSVTATATANTGYDFVNWTVGGTEVSTSASYEFTPTAATDLVANFEAHQYSVKFIADGNQYAHVNVLYGESINPNLQGPDKTGYTFKGWDPEIPAAIVEDMTFNAVYEVNKYNLTFIVDGKETTYQVAYGALIPDYLPSDISKEGYTCTGWSPSLSVKMPAEDVTYTAQFTKNILVSDFALAATTATVDENGTTTVKYTTSSTGAVTATSSSENVTVSVDESAKTITITGVKAGDATITVSQASDDDHYGSEPLTIAVAVNAIDLTQTLEYKVNGSLTFGYDATASREVYEFGGIYNNQVYGTPTTNIVAGKPYIVTAGDDLVLTYKSDATELTNADCMQYNGFWGVLGDPMAVAGAEYMVFFNGNLYYATEDVANANMVPAGHAFFFVPEIPTGEPTGTAKAIFKINFDDFTTGINSVTTALKNNTPVYNISGQRVSSAKKGGIYLVNGKKIVVK